MRLILVFLSIYISIYANDSLIVKQDSTIIDTTTQDSVQNSDSVGLVNKVKNNNEPKYYYNDSSVVKYLKNKTKDSINSSIEYRYVNSGNLIVRNKPTTNSKIVTRLKRGTRVRFIKKDSTKKWSKIKFYANDSGWIFNRYLNKNRLDAIPSYLRKCDFSGVKKKGDIPGNPKRDIKGIYLTIYSTSGKMINKLIKLANNTEINAFVIDVKDDAGRALFHLKSAEKYAPSANRYNVIKDIKKFIDKLHKHNIYAIARIVSFKDPQFAKYHQDKLITFKDSGKPYKSSDGLIWASAYNRDLWDYNVSVAKECAEAGFNEIQFDYVRFPAAKSFDNLDLKNSLNEYRAEAIQGYLMYAYSELYDYPVYISADIYGLVCSNEGDLSIGQNWEAISSVVDYICPMMYPSHYYNGSFGIKVPDKEPYKTIYYSIRDAVHRNYNIDNPAIIRPWFQAFTAVWLKERLSYNKYNIHEQMRAANEFGITQYLLWNAANRYYRAFYDISEPKKDTTVLDSNIQKVSN